MNKQISELYRLILKHNWRVEKMERRPIYNHSKMTMQYTIDLISPNNMVDADFMLFDIHNDSPNGAFHATLP